MLAVSDQPVGGELLTALQHELAELTENASIEVVQGASHESLVSNREHARVVANAIQAVVQAASGSPSQLLICMAVVQALLASPCLVTDVTWQL
jgi:2-keto-3-deoxy-L-rhamnonate aldolase RhmA